MNHDPRAALPPTDDDAVGSPLLDSLMKSGVDTSHLLPDYERRSRGPVVVVECFQEIPCDPCVSACKRGAITLSSIADRPSVDFDRCNGCGTCIARCPGQAIFVVDETYSETEAVVAVPYELLPLPEQGERVTGLDRAGRPVCAATVARVQSNKTLDRTTVVWLAVPKELSMGVRFLGRVPGPADPGFGASRSPSLEGEGGEAVSRVADHPILGRPPEARTVTITVDGRRVAAREGEVVAASLLAAGIRTFRYTAKKYEPRGIFCAIGQCTDCVMVVNGVPNVRTCVTPVVDGMVIQTQRGLNRK